MSEIFLIFKIENVKKAECLIIKFYQKLELYPFHLNPGQAEKNNLTFYFHTLWCLNKTFYGTTKKFGNQVSF